MASMEQVSSAVIARLQEENKQLHEENIRLRLLIATFKRVFLDNDSDISWEEWRSARNVVSGEVLKIAQQVKETQS